MADNASVHLAAHRCTAQRTETYAVRRRRRKTNLFRKTAYNASVQLTAYRYTEARPATAYPYAVRRRRRKTNPFRKTAYNVGVHLTAHTYTRRATHPCTLRRTGARCSASAPAQRQRPTHLAGHSLTHRIRLRPINILALLLRTPGIRTARSHRTSTTNRCAR